MRLLDSFGPALHQYEGMGRLARSGFEDGVEVSFEVRQLENGEVVVGVVGSDDFSPLADCLSGVTVEPAGEIDVSDLHFIEIHYSGMGIANGVASCRQVMLKRSPRSNAAVERMEFSLVNLAFHQSSKVFVSFEAEVNSYALRFSAASRYEPIVDRLRRLPGVLPTAVCVCEKVNDDAFDRAEAVGVIDGACFALSLATGNKVTWVNWQSDGITTARTSSTKAFSPQVLDFGWRLDPVAAIAAWARSTDTDYLRGMVDYFLDSAATTPFLQTRALAAVSLLDALTNRYAQQRGFDLLMSDGEWSRLLPSVRETLKGIHGSLIANVNALPRRPFREMLRKMLKELRLTTVHVNDVVEIRNRVIHSGSLLPGVPKWDQYRLVLWTSFAVLARLIGYDREIYGAPVAPLLQAG